MIDTPRHQGLRNILAQDLEKKGIQDKNVLNAIRKIPRHLFLDSIFEEQAYKDMAFRIAAGQTISRPHTVAFQTELLQVKAGQKVLEIGTGSGYQSAILVSLNVNLYTIERQIELFKKTNLFLKKINFYPKKIVFGDGYKGLPDEAPFDRIIVTAGAPFVPKALLSQLKIGGRLVIPVFINCNKKNVQLPQVEKVEVDDMHDYSEVFIFFDEKEKTSELNRNNLISSTHWVFHIDKRCSLYEVGKNIIFLQEKKANPFNPHYNPDSHNFFSIAQMKEKKLGFIDFTEFNFTEFQKNDTINPNDIAFVCKNEIQINNKKINLESLNISENNSYIWIFDGNLSFQDFITIFHKISYLITNKEIFILKEIKC